MLSIKIIKFLLPDVLWPSERKTLGSGSRSLRCWLSLRLSAMWDIFKELHLIFLNQAFLIAFTSDFIQKLVYKFEYGERGVMKGYVMFTLSKSPVKNWISRGQVSPKKITLKNWIARQRPLWSSIHKSLTWFLALSLSYKFSFQIQHFNPFQNERSCCHVATKSI